MSSRGDPYDVAKAEVEAAVNKVQFMHKDWKRLLEKQNTADSQRFQDLHSELVGELQLLDYTLQDVDKSIQAVEQNRGKFHLTDAQVQVRRAFLNKCTAVRRDIDSDLKSRTVTAKMEDDRRQSLLGSQKGSSQHDRSRQAAEDAFGHEQQLHAQLIDQQEDELAELAKATQRVGHVAKTIKGELETQERMLDELNDDLDSQLQNMNGLMRGVGKVLKTGNKSHMFGLCGLISIFFLLVFLIFTT